MAESRMAIREPLDGGIKYENNAFISDLNVL